MTGSSSALSHRSAGHIPLWWVRDVPSLVCGLTGLALPQRGKPSFSRLGRFCKRHGEELQVVQEVWTRLVASAKQQTLDRRERAADSATSMVLQYFPVWPTDAVLAQLQPSLKTLALNVDATVLSSSGGVLLSCDNLLY